MGLGWTGRPVAVREAVSAPRTLGAYLYERRTGRQATGVRLRNYAANSLATCTGCQSARPRGVLTPRACSVRAMPVNVSTPLAWISRTTAAMLAFDLAA